MRLFTRPDRKTLAALLLLVVSAGALAVVFRLVSLSMSDIAVYRAEGEAAASGGDLYGFTVTEWKLPATYPPFAALLFIPTTWLPLGALKVVSVLVNAALIPVLLHLSYKAAYTTGTAGPRGTARLSAARTLPAVLAATALAIWLEPVFQTIVFGQINLALTCLVLWDLARPDGARLKGFAIGIATGVKLTPAVFAVYLLITGRVRAACTAFAGFAVSVLLGLLVLPDASVEFWTRRMFETGRVGKAWIVDNQSLQGLLTRVLHTPEPGLLWAVLALATGMAGLFVARRVYLRRGLDSWGVLCTAVTALLVSPISWSHHWVWCVPLLVALGAHTHGVRWRRVLIAAVALAFTARTMWVVPHQGDLDLKLPWWQQPLAAPYPLLGLALLAAVAWWSRRTPAGPPTTLARRPFPLPRGPRGSRPARELSTRIPER
ncbi:glycosyltransferase 87 family protein [Streptomyces rimosus]|uniref:glycosyltransferase 87 family protein n=1 Tax=Streptomyces rimosus TaxID=1927 RepID=UPI00067E4EA6|nr:glycosyltransferase 87 family protein [Streptomyces rimosus]